MSNWERIATDRLRILWVMAAANGGTLRIGKSIIDSYPGDAHAEVFTSTDLSSGDFIVEARSKDRV